MTHKSKGILFLAVLVLLIFVLRQTSFGQFLTLEKCLESFELIRSQWWSPLVFIGLHILGPLLLIPATPFMILGGLLFGFAKGSLYSWIGANLGLSAAFLAGRYLFRDYAARKLAGREQLEKWDRKIRDSGWKLILRLRLIPVTPFTVLNYGFGLTAIRFRDFLLGSALGMLPVLLTYSYAAHSIVANAEKGNRQLLLSLAALGAVLILISFLPAFAKHLGCKPEDGCEEKGG